MLANNQLNCISIVNMHSRIIYSVLLLSLLFCSVSSAETIKMGYFNIPPHSYSVGKDNSPKGASIKYFEALASRMGIKIEWVGPLPFPRLIAALKEGTIDGSILLTKNRERTAFLYYPETSIFPTYPVFVVKKDNPLNKISSIEDVMNYRVGFLTGANQTGFLKNNLNKLNMEYIPGENWVGQNLNKLIKGRLDAVYDLNQFTMMYQAKAMKIDDQIKILPLPGTPSGFYTVFSKSSPKGALLLEKYNKALKDNLVNYYDYLDREYE